MTLPLLQDDSSVCYSYLLQFTYLINSPKVKAVADNAHLRYKRKIADICTIHWCQLHQ